LLARHDARASPDQPAWQARHLSPCLIHAESRGLWRPQGTRPPTPLGSPAPQGSFRHVNQPMKIIVTCGPSYEPIDQARRMTNFSTGRLGIALANALADQGWEVICFKGEQATCADPLRVHTVRAFSTNQDLADQLDRLSRDAH